MGPRHSTQTSRVQTYATVSEPFGPDRFGPYGMGGVPATTDNRINSSPAYYANTRSNSNFANAFVPSSDSGRARATSLGNFPNTSVTPQSSNVFNPAYANNAGMAAGTPVLSGSRMPHNVNPVVPNTYSPGYASASTSRMQEFTPRTINNAASSTSSSPWFSGSFTGEPGTSRQGATSASTRSDYLDDLELLLTLTNLSRPSAMTFYMPQEITCPTCKTSVSDEQIDTHLLTCFSKPPIVYNEDVLTENKGECNICLDDMEENEIIARLPCLCIYHKSCIDEWFGVNRTCPQHPGA